MNCRAILSLPYANQLKLLAGKSGLDNEIRWVHYLENPDYIDWLKGGELIISSGLVTSDNETELRNLIHGLWEHQVSGIIINLSFYITKVPDSIKEFCDEIGMPLFEMPANVRIADISQSICFAIFDRQKQHAETETLLLDLYFGRRMSGKRLENCKKYGLEEGKKYQGIVIVVHINEKKETEPNESRFYEERQDLLVSRIMNDFTRFTGSNFITQKEDELIGIVPAQEQSFFAVLKETLKSSSPDVGMRIGIGSVFQTIKKIRDSIETAEKALDMETNRELVLYNNMPLLKLLKAADSNDALPEIMAETLGRLLEEKNRDILDTLISYFNCNEDSRETAKQMYLHPNTVQYRLKKAESILEISLKDSEAKHHLWLALKIHDYVG